MIRDFKILQVIPLFQAVATSKADTVFQNLFTDDKITPNKCIYLFFYISDMKLLYIQVPLYLRILLDPKFLCNSGLVFSGCLFWYFLYKKRRIKNKQLLVKNHAW